MEEKEIFRFSSGETIVQIPDVKSVAVRFRAPKKVVSTSLLNGGYRDDLTAVFNYTCGTPTGPCMSISEYQAHLKSRAVLMGMDPERTTGIGTAADMKNVSVKTVSYEALTVTACVTAGVKGNAGRAGDPAAYYGAYPNEECIRLGTINCMLFIDANMSPGILTRGLVTATEAKTAALQELLVGSRYSSGLATGTGTDSTIIVADPLSPLYFYGAGKHSKLGELIGRAVKDAVKEALCKQNGLCPAFQQSVSRRLYRYGMEEKTLYEAYVQSRGGIESERFLAMWERLDGHEKVVVTTSLYAHLLDEYLWGLERETVVKKEAIRLLHSLGETFGVLPHSVEGGAKEDFLHALRETLFSCMEKVEKDENR